jgi:hypothetical protein
MIIHAYVYAKDGNRFIIPGHWYCDDDPEIGLGSHAICLCEGLMFGAVLGMKHDGWLDVEADERGHGSIMHLPYRFVGPQFANGAVDVLLIGGSLMDD